ncbi:hypothetical protein IWQ61_007642 [Dispira simplex]|nr:hypothetical protein IWQ61_007642 [Dispira simplex]
MLAESWSPILSIPRRKHGPSVRPNSPPPQLAWSPPAKDSPLLSSWITPTSIQSSRTPSQCTRCSILDSDADTHSSGGLTAVATPDLSPELDQTTQSAHKRPGNTLRRLFRTKRGILTDTTNNLRVSGLVQSGVQSPSLDEPPVLPPLPLGSNGNLDLTTLGYLPCPVTPSVSPVLATGEIPPAPQGNISSPVSYSFRSTSPCPSSPSFPNTPLTNSSRYISRPALDLPETVRSDLHVRPKGSLNRLWHPKFYTSPRQKSTQQGDTSPLSPSKSVSHRNPWYHWSFGKRRPVAPVFAPSPSLSPHRCDYSTPESGLDQRLSLSYEPTHDTSDSHPDRLPAPVWKYPTPSPHRVVSWETPTAKQPSKRRSSIARQRSLPTTHAVSGHADTGLTSPLPTSGQSTTSPLASAKPLKRLLHKMNSFRHTKPTRNHTPVSPAESCSSWYIVTKEELGPIPNSESIPPPDNIGQFTIPKGAKQQSKAPDYGSLGYAFSQDDPLELFHEALPEDTLAFEWQSPSLAALAGPSRVLPTPLDGGYALPNIPIPPRNSSLPACKLQPHWLTQSFSMGEDLGSSTQAAVGTTKSITTTSTDSTASRVVNWLEAHQNDSMVFDEANDQMLGAKVTQCERVSIDVREAPPCLVMNFSRKKGARKSMKSIHEPTLTSPYFSTVVTYPPGYLPPLHQVTWTSPPSYFALGYLTLNHTRVESLRCFTALPNLTKVAMAHNSLRRWPADFCELTHLRYLDFSHNLLRSVPETLGSLHRLLVLDLSHNRLTTLPPTVGQLGSLRVLQLEGNPIQVLPSTIAGLTRTLEVFHLGQWPTYGINIDHQVPAESTSNPSSSPTSTLTSPTAGTPNLPAASTSSASSYHLERRILVRMMDLISERLRKVEHEAGSQANPQAMPFTATITVHSPVPLVAEALLPSQWPSSSSSTLSSAPLCHHATVPSSMCNSTSHFPQPMTPWGENGRVTIRPYQVGDLSPVNQPTSGSATGQPTTANGLMDYEKMLTAFQAYEKVLQKVNFPVNIAT